MTSRHRLVRVPASSANLGPGYDSLAAALEPQLELEVAEAREHSVDVGGLDVSSGRENLIVRAFESLHPADRVAFKIRSEIPLARGLGSSAAAIVAGLMAADHLFELGNDRDDLFRLATEIEGHPDNVAAALYGGFTVCAGGGPPVRIAPPEGLEGLIVVPAEEVSTEDARRALPAEVPIADAVHNFAAAAALVLGLERNDPALIARGLADRLHQERRRTLYPRSIELVEAASALGALGATISGAGPSVLVWTTWQETGTVSRALAERTAGWAEVRRVAFSIEGADVPEL